MRGPLSEGKVRGTYKGTEWKGDGSAYSTVDQRGSGGGVPWWIGVRAWVEEEE